MLALIAPQNEDTATDLICQLRAVLPRLLQQPLAAGPEATRAALEALMRDGDLQRLLEEGLRASGRHVAETTGTRHAHQ